jgi:hypothetical protein
VSGPGKLFVTGDGAETLAAAHDLLAQGYDVVTSGDTAGETWQMTARRCLQYRLLDCGAVAMTPGWADRPADLLLVYVASQLGMPTFQYDPPAAHRTAGEA